ncbi:MAG: sugar nucleotide-binding protein, partial [Acidobacteriota bacterium]
ILERDLSGVFHVGGGAPVSWFDYAKLIFAKAGLSVEVQPTNEREYRTAARRPKYSALENARMKEFGIKPMPPMGEAVEAYLRARERSIPQTDK